MNTDPRLLTPISKPGPFASMSDAELASTVRMLSRNDLYHEPIVCAARDRIVALSAEVSLLKENAKCALIEVATKMQDMIDIQRMNHAGAKEGWRLAVAELNALREENERLKAAANKG